MKKHLARTIALVLVAAMDAAPAFAQSLDVQNGANTVVALIIALFGVIALGIAAWQGLEAMPASAGTSAKSYGWSWRSPRGTGHAGSLSRSRGATRRRWSGSWRRRNGDSRCGAGL
ncbi:MAG: hypothetical protein ACJ8AW_40830 [Rhodopila sp.]